MAPGCRATDDTWQWWDMLRRMCAPTAKLAVSLELTADLPEAGLVARWLGEPLKAVVVPTSIFLTNKKGFPVLSKVHQTVVREMFKLDPQYVLSGNPEGPEGFAPYLRYLSHLFETRPPEGPVEKFAAGYEDYLQAPLQPLMDNLESQTYETFEKDPIKYQQYEAAVHAALLDRVPEAERPTALTTVMVVGAGRGPLVQCAFAAAKRAGCRIKMFAIEKNPNAVVTLRARNLSQWEGQCTIVSTDMRVWETAERADIMVSELLGSFGDNELSPECLDGAQKFLASDGISIPADSRSFIAPLSAHKLHTELLGSKDKKHLETPYVVMLRNAHRLGEVQQVFKFVHPNPENDTPAGADNERYARLQFEVPGGGTMHGMVGYFESVLYKDVSISINPATHSPGMFSWFPIYFPLRAPMFIAAGATVELHMWRKTSRTKVWYEWAVTRPDVTPIHNSNGSSYFIGL